MSGNTGKTCEYCGDPVVGGQTLCSDECREGQREWQEREDLIRTRNQQIIASKRFPKKCVTCERDFFAHSTHVNACSDDCRFARMRHLAEVQQERRKNPPPPPTCNTCQRLFTPTRGGGQNLTECKRCEYARINAKMQEEYEQIRTEHEQIRANAVLWQRDRESRRKLREARAANREALRLAKRLRDDADERSQRAQEKKNAMRARRVVERAAYEYFAETGQLTLLEEELR